MSEKRRRDQCEYLRVFLTIFQVDTTACNTSLEGIASSCTGKVDLDREILPFVFPFN